MKTTLPYLCLFMTVAHLTCYGQPPQDTRWNITPDQGIAWQVKENDTHFDHIEMSGLYLSSIVHYGVDQGTIKQKVHLVFPMLRTIPNDTHASLSHDIDYHELDPIKINGVPAVETPKQFGIKGVLAIRSVANEGIEISHQLFPSTNQAVFIDQIQVHNPTNQEVSIDIPKIEWSHTTAADQGVYGAYTIQVRSDRHGKFTLKPNETLDYALIYSGKMASEALPYVASNYELNRRNKLVHETFSNLVLESPDEVINREFAFAKLRAVESIFYTKGGLMHAPGGGSYYAAIWANDQAEYANPFFPFQGNLEANESAINSFRHFARYMNPDYRPIPSSIIAEGTDFWNGAGDRGDMAMIAYVASRFALANGDLKSVQELWPLITWCLEYCRRQLNEEGVVRSDSDELEGRFPAGKANLNNSSLYYDALVSAVYLGKELKADPTILNQYRLQSERIQAAIETYFGTTVSGFETYQYYEGNDVLRAWICTPLTVDIFSRSHGTIDALFSEKLLVPVKAADLGEPLFKSTTPYWRSAIL